jgi:putative hydrolase of the HAD superfamily
MGPEPKVIFLDAVGTLFGVKGGVGEIYRQVAALSGVSVSAERLDLAFRESFSGAPPLAFPGVARERVTELERRWWGEIVRSTFESAGYLDRFADFERFFGHLYECFATAEPWTLYPDVPPSLERWRERGIELGIVSNFDSRIEAVLRALEIERHFHSITISSLTGAAKPDPRLFREALAKHDCPAGRAWHIGDSRREDYEGAKAVGMRAILIARHPSNDRSARPGSPGS